jgi:copper ion binding protein
MSDKTTGRFAVEGMHCNGCVRSVTGAVSRIPGVDKVDVSLADAQATVAYDASAVQPAQIVEAIQAAGFEARPL